MTDVDLTFTWIKLSLTLVVFTWKKKLLRLLLTPRAWRVVLVCPHSISVSVITNYTNMAATSHVKLGFLKPKVNFVFVEFRHYYEGKMNVVSTSFKKINKLRCATRKGEVGRFPLFFFVFFFENRQPVPNF